MHKAQLILDAVVAMLDGLKVASPELTVDRNRATPIPIWPGIAVRMGPDEPVRIDGQTSDWRLTVYTDIHVEAAQGDLDGDTLQWRLEIHKALLADPTLGLGFVIDTESGGQLDPSFDGEGELPIGVTRLAWFVTYRANTMDPSL